MSSKERKLKELISIHGSMNIPQQLIRKICYFMILCCMPLMASAQFVETEVVQVQIVKNEALAYPFYNANLWASISQNASNGDSSLDYPGSSYVGEYALDYVPNTDFVGTDEVVVRYFKNYPTPPYNRQVQLHLQITILPAYIKAFDDFATTKINESVDIDVLSNDDWTDGMIEPHVEGVTNVNSGTGVCSVNCGSVIFTPAVDFVGLAHLNYTICNEEGDCDDAIVNILVEPTVVPQYDSLFIITSEDVEKVVLFDLSGYSVLNEPSLGDLGFDETGFIPTYLPNSFGVDEFTYEKTEDGTQYIRYVQVDVLDVPASNVFLTDDHAYATKNNSVAIDYSENDLLSTVSATIGQQPVHGTVSIDVVNGTFQHVYQPDTDFVGIDKYTYRVWVGVGELETATVYVHINNLEPSLPVFNFNTVKNVPYVIDYNIPVDTYSFEVTGSPENNTANTVEILDGFATYTWGNQETSGNNQIVFTPATDFVGIEEFELQYCVTGGDCSTVKIIVDVLDIVPNAEDLCIGDNCIWPGDTNHDGLVNMKDVLPIGLCMGEEGTERTSSDLLGSDWYGQYSQDWNDPFEVPGFDLKHIDTNGDSIISSLDTAAVRAHYGNIHNIIPVAEPAIPLPIYLVDLGDGGYEIGDMASIGIVLGSNANYQDLALNVHGIATTLNYSPDFVAPNTMKIDFPVNTWMSYDSPTLGMDYDVYEEGKIDFAYTRTNGVSIDGYGLIARADFVIIEDLADIRPGEEGYLTLPFSLDGTSIMGDLGNYFSLADTELNLTVRIPSKEEQGPVTAQDLRLFPNPTGDVVNLYLNGYGNELGSYEIFTTSGQRMTQGEVNAKSATLDVSTWQTGIYLVRVVTNEGEVVNKKFEVIR